MEMRTFTGLHKAQEMRTFIGPHKAQGLGGEAAEFIPELEAEKEKSAGTVVSAWKK